MMEPTTASLLAEAFEEASRLDAPINDRLAHYAEALRRHFGAYADVFDRLVGRLQQTAAGESAPQVGERMPPFLLPDQHGRLVHLDDLVRSGPVAVAFLRGHWCPYCRLTAHALADAATRAEAFGGRIVALSPERQQFIQAQSLEIDGARARSQFSILSDHSNGYAMSLNLAIWIGQEMEQLLSRAGHDLPDYQGTSSWFVPIPATFVIARDGTIVARFVDPDYSRRMDVDDLLAALASGGQSRPPEPPE